MELDRVARIEKKVDNLAALNQLRKKWRKVADPGDFVGVG
jgi:hypothetical protein